MVLSVKSYSNYLKARMNLPEDNLIEFRQALLSGKTFVLGEDHAERRRAAWREGALKVDSRELSPSDIDEMIGDSPNEPFSRAIPLNSFTKYLAQYWEATDADYPDPQKLAAMNMGELMIGKDWKYVDNL